MDLSPFAQAVGGWSIFRLTGTPYSARGHNGLKPEAQARDMAGFLTLHSGFRRNVSFLTASPTLPPGGQGQHLDVEHFVRAEANLIAADAEDARASGAEHFDSRTAAEPELLQAVHVIRVSGNATNAGLLPAAEFFQWNRSAGHGGGVLSYPP